MAHTLATASGYLAEEVHQVGSCERGEGDAIVERGHIDHVAVGDIARRQ